MLLCYRVSAILLIGGYQSSSTLLLSRACDSALSHPEDDGFEQVGADDRYDDYFDVYADERLCWTDFAVQIHDGEAQIGSLGVSSLVRVVVLVLMCCGLPERGVCEGYAAQIRSGGGGVGILRIACESSSLCAVVTPVLMNVAERKSVGGRVRRSGAGYARKADGEEGDA